MAERGDPYIGTKIMVVLFGLMMTFLGGMYCEHQHICDSICVSEGWDHGRGARSFHECVCAMDPVTGRMPKENSNGR